MKKLLEFTIQKREETCVVVSYNDRDYDVSKPEDENKIREFVLEVLERDKRRSRPMYEWRDEGSDILIVREVSVNACFEAEVMQKPSDWLLKRVQKALAGCFSELERRVPGSSVTIEISPEGDESTTFRRVFTVNGMRLIPDGDFLRMAGIVTEEGELDYRVDVNHRIAWLELHRRLMEAGVKISESDMISRFCDAFGWKDERGRFM